MTLYDIEAKTIAGETKPLRDYAGKVLQPAVAPASGPVLFLVTSLAINKGDPFLAVGA
jgi:hypothetical protein